MASIYLAVLALLVGVVSAIWPVPISLSEGNTTVLLCEDFTIEFVAPQGTHGFDTTNKVWGAIERTYELLNDGFVPRMLFPFEEDFEPSVEELGTSQKLEKLIITQTYISLRRD